MNKVISHAKTNIKRIALGGSGLLVGVMSLGMTASVSADSYSRGNDNWDSSWSRNSSWRSNDRYDQYRFEYSRRYERVVRYGHDKYNNRWENCDDNSDFHYNDDNRYQKWW